MLILGTGETLLITNFEVDDPKEHIDERNGVKIYGGGVRGLRAFKQTRDDEEEEKNEESKLKREYIEAHGDKFKRFEHKISKKNRLSLNGHRPTSRVLPMLTQPLNPILCP